MFGVTYSILLSSCFWLLVPGIGYTENIGMAHVVKVIDGDSLVLNFESQIVQVRLWGIDTPEYGQRYSEDAKQFTRRMAQGKAVSVFVKDWDKYGRMVAIVQLDGDVSLNRELLKAGFAWVHIYYCKEAICDSWHEIEEKARRSGKGLWQQSNPMPPWQWKRLNKRH